MATLCVLAQAAVGYFGVDVSSGVTSAAWKSLESDCTGQGALHFAIPRVWKSYGAIDAVGIASITAAHAAGISDVDGYLFPDVSKPAAPQVAATLAGLKAAGASIGRLWLDIEPYKWPASTATNQAFIKELVDATLGSGTKAGVYSNWNSWATIAGTSWNYPATMGLPIWYPHYDNSPSFSDFKPFGGWKTPLIKQYAGDKTACGLGLDYNYKAGGPAPPGPTPPSPSPGGACKTFQSGLCAGPASCMCTLGAVCSARGVHGGVELNFSTPSGACAGSCRTVVHNECPGGNDCIKDGGPC